MVFSSFLVNMGILLFTSDGWDKLIDPDSEESDRDIIVVLVVVEHAILVSIFVLNIFVK